MRKIGMALMVAAVGLFGFGMAVHAVYPPPVIITVSTNTPAPGAAFTATLTGCTEGGTVDFTVQGSKASSVCGTVATAGGNGFALTLVAQTTTTSATGSLTAPTAPGKYTVTGTDLESGNSANAEITVSTTPATKQPSGKLPSTGSGSSNTTVLIAATLLVMGLAFFGVSQVRRRHAPTA